MRRRPNPWIVIPALIAGIVGGALGWVVTDVSCRVELDGGVIANCPGWSTLFAVVGALAGLIGMSVVMVLVFRSLGEWRSQQGDEK
ncbi:MAG: hypothetical protein GEU79_09810 [Acidimicrobiia bacterium]|nr:hypothetical protein [Acidimicrobiia bacterium]